MTNELRLTALSISFWFFGDSEVIQLGIVWITPGKSASHQEIKHLRDARFTLDLNFRITRDQRQRHRIPVSEWSSRFRCFSEGVLQGFVTLVFAKCKNKVLASLRSLDGWPIYGTKVGHHVGAAREVMRARRPRRAG